MNAMLLIVEKGESSPIWKVLSPVLSQLGFGGVLGLAVGFLFKKTLKLLAIIVGLLFIFLIAMAQAGYIQGINWMKMGQDFSRAFDRGFFNGLWHFLVGNIPFAGAFTVGFILGFKWG